MKRFVDRGILNYGIGVLYNDCVQIPRRSSDVVVRLVCNTHQNQIRSTTDLFRGDYRG